VKANPARLSDGTPGVGTTLHIRMERIAQVVGVEFLHVPFRGFADNSASLLGGNTRGLADSCAWAPLVEAGWMRALCVWTAKRVARFRDVPTLHERGNDIVSTSPYGVGGPAGIPREMVRTLDAVPLTALDDPQHLQVLKCCDMVKIALDHAAYSEEVKRMVEV
jgi:tripartite-type tricarboxylate transporter receptor subunit TctC